MATTTAPVSSLRTARIALRILVVLVAVVLVCLLVAGAWFYSAARASLPQVDGQIKISGLSARVTVTRDAQGVPHLSAATLEDLFFAQGYVTAQDRLWQMDMTRRFAAGELAEILGAKYVEHDREQRLLSIRPVAEKAAASLPARDRAWFEAYARGVNAYIAGQKHLPIEFRVLRYQPRPWTATDSFLVATSMVQMLTMEIMPHQLAREKLAAKVGPELAADLYPNSSWRDHPPVSAPGQDEFVPAGEEQQPEEEQPERPAPRSHPRRPAHSRRGARVMKTASVPQEPWAKVSSPDFDQSSPGSNNWVVSGAHTVSGKPLLANDMHLLHQLPNVWYEAQLSSGSFDVAGVTLPGVPFVVVGHNQRIAWGFTNIQPAVTDLFVEVFNDRGEYQTPEGWRQPEHRREVIHVHGQPDVIVDVTVTRHGPVISDRYPGELRRLALKWTLYDPTALQVPLFDMNAAQNWEQFREALRHFSSPAQNVIYADAEGHIAYQATGLIPLRTAGDGSVPVSGADSAYEWTGYIPFEQLPTAFDPPSAIIATANGRIVPDGYSLAISNEWGPPYRTERIYRVLSAPKKLSTTDMLALQTDIYSDLDRYCAQRFVYSVDHVSSVSQRVREAADLMREWNGQVTADSAAANIVARSRRELTRLLLEPKVGGMWAEYRWFMSSVWLENMLSRQPAPWLPPNYAGWDDLLAAAVSAAVSEPEAPRKLQDWRWGKQQALDIEHPLFGRVPLLRHWAGTGRVAQSGNGYTVKQVNSRLGPSERMTVDFSDLDNSTLNIVNGESGQIFSPHYMDQWNAWYGGTTFTLPFSPAAVKKAKAHVLTLESSK
jgi:penicillin amidase